MAVVRGLFEDVGKLRPALKGARHFAEVALLDCTNPVRQTVPLADSLRGWTAALVEGHWLYDTLPVEKLGEDLPPELQTIVVSDAGELPAQAWQALDQFCQQGGAVVLTHRSGLSGAGKALAAQSQLQELTGIGQVLGLNPRGPSDHGQWYTRVATEDSKFSNCAERLLSYRGQAVEFEPGDSEVLAVRLGLDISRHSRHNTIQGWYPGSPTWPLIAGHPLGSGHVVYIGGDLETSFYRYGDPDAFQLLLAALAWAHHHEPIVETNLPGSVEITCRYQPENNVLAVFLLNMTCNQYRGDYVVRFAVPLKDVRVTLRLGGKVQAVKTITGPEAKVIDDEAGLDLRLCELHEYEVITVEFESGLNWL